MKKNLLTCLLIVLFPVLSFAQNGDNANSGDYVVVLHGIARSSSHMAPLAEFLSQNGYDVINMDYPSTDYRLDKLAKRTSEQLATKLIDKDKTVHFVGYSMGGLLTRIILNKYRPENLGRVVQLAAPNHGSEVSDFLENNWLYQKIYGPAGQQLVTRKQDDLAELLGKVDYELGVVAGNSTIDPISSTIIPNDDDGKVSIESTKVEGMKDHIVVSASHTFFPSNKQAQAQALYFLKNGQFNHKNNKGNE